MCMDFLTNNFSSPVVEEVPCLIKRVILIWFQKKKWSNCVGKYNRNTVHWDLGGFMLHLHAHLLVGIVSNTQAHTHTACTHAHTYKHTRPLDLHCSSHGRHVNTHKSINIESCAQVGSESAMKTFDIVYQTLWFRGKNTSHVITIAVKCLVKTIFAIWDFKIVHFSSELKCFVNYSAMHFWELGFIHYYEWAEVVTAGLFCKGFDNGSANQRFGKWLSQSKVWIMAQPIKGLDNGSANQLPLHSNRFG